MSMPPVHRQPGPIGPRSGFKVAAFVVITAAIALFGGVYVPHLQASTSVKPVVYGMWTDSAVPRVPADPENVAVTVGVQFTASEDGWISGLQFYRSAENVGPHQGRLWSRTGVVAQVNFAPAARAGWQTALFDRPVAITRGTQYTASYRAPAGRYAGDEWTLGSGKSVTAGALTARRGVYTYGFGRPTRTWHDSNYFVDVLFSTLRPTPPPLTSPGQPTPTTAAPTTAAPTTAAPTTAAPTTAAPTTAAPTTAAPTTAAPTTAAPTTAAPTTAAPTTAAPTTAAPTTAAPTTAAPTTAAPTTAAPTTAAPPRGGFPTRATAGVPAGWAPTRSVTGNYTVNSAGAVVEDLRITNGSLIVNAPNVTIRRVEVLGGSINNGTGSTCRNGLVIESSTISRAPGQTTRGDEPAIGTGGYTARNVKIDGLPEGFRVGGRADIGCGPVVIENSFASISSPDVCGDWHGDGLQGYDGASVTIRNSVLELIERNGCGGTAPFFYPANQGNSSVDIDGLIVKGGGASFRLGTSGSVRNLSIVENSWFYFPIEVNCSLLSAWSAQVAKLDANGQPVRVRSQPC